ncbi:MAG: dockerin type I repeat-containing protein, partial [Acutalibacteraceae bacterium]|nr:dockerin type I repeat-containing protein [Acutalibacteraceae bacterium]
YLFAVRYRITEDKLFSKNACATAETLKEDYKSGDLNGDGNCSVIDMLIMRRILFGTLEPDQSQLRSSDYNSDGYINILDQQRLLADML